jgi:PAS domain S-box-containing protein
MKTIGLSDLPSELVALVEKIREGEEGEVHIVDNGTTVARLLPSGGENVKVIRAIRERLASPDSGLWYQLTNRKTGRRHPFHLTKTYLDLYGYKSISEMPRNRLLLIDKPFRKMVAETLYRARQHPEKLYECTFRIIANGGDRKWVYARLMRFALNDKLEVFASWHVDVTALQERQRFYEHVLDTVQGFVFVKQQRPGTKTFEFRYINKALTRALGLEDPKDALDLTDGDFLPIASEVKSFEEKDLEAAAAATSDVVNVYEEQFTPAGVGAPKRLATVKVPFDTALFDPHGKTQRCVLGIAIDITPITDLLHSVLDHSRDGIFVKDSECRYIVVNEMFLRLLGLEPSCDIRGLTFRDVMYKFKLSQFTAELRQTISDVERDDMKILAGGSSTERRKAAFGDGRVWETKKTPIRTGSQTRYILGIARDIHDIQRVNDTILTKLPYFICIKDEDFRIVRCNQSYAERHGASSPLDLYGKTDFDLWPEEQFPGQAQGYRNTDKAILRLATDLEAAPSFEAKAEILRPYTEYEEPQYLGPGKEAKLRTTKWPEKIGDRWHIVVVYSDVTPIHRELERFHAFTVHSFRNQLLSIGVARDLLGRAAAADDPKPLLDKPLQFLRMGTDALNFYIQHLLKFLQSRIDPSRFDSINLFELFETELKLVREISVGLLTVEIIAKGASTSAFVWSDKEYMTILAKELFYNARKAVYRRVEAQKAKGSFSPGRIEVHLDLLRKDERDVLEIAIHDTGDCCDMIEARERLGEEWKKAEQWRPNVNSRHFGLAIIRWIIAEHGGRCYFDCSDQRTTFSISFTCMEYPNE